MLRLMYFPSASSWDKAEKERASGGGGGGVVGGKAGQGRKPTPGMPNT